MLLAYGVVSVLFAVVGKININTQTVEVEAAAAEAAQKEEEELLAEIREQKRLEAERDDFDPDEEKR